MTVYKAQGMTTGQTFTLAGDTLSGEEGYVALSRGRVANHLYAVIPDPAPARTSPVRDTDPLVAALARSRAQHLAVESLPDVARLARENTLGELEAQADELAARLRRGLPADRAADLAASAYNVEAARQGIAAAQAARADLAAQLEQTSMLQRSRRAALAALLNAATQAEAGWAAALAVHQPHLDADHAHQARRTQWLAAHAADLEHHTALRQAAATRRANLIYAAALSPPYWLVDVLGPQPDTRTGRRLWQAAAGDLLAWRDRHGITDPRHPLGPAPQDGLHQLQRQQLARHLRQTAEHLGHQPTPETERHLDRGHDLGLGL